MCYSVHVVQSMPAAEPAQEPETVRELRIVVSAMRELGVVEYAGIRLGPDPKGQQLPKDESQQETPAERERRMREARRAVTLGATGGLLRRLEDY